MGFRSLWKRLALLAALGVAPGPVWSNTLATTTTACPTSLPSVTGTGTAPRATDIQAAVDPLSEPGPKRVFVEPGSYAPPASPARPHGLVELPSHVVLECAGPDVTVLRGLPATVKHSTARSSQTRITWPATKSIQIVNCQIDAGMPGAYDSTT